MLSYQARARDHEPAAFPGVWPLAPGPCFHNFGIMLEPRWTVGTERLDQ